ncbi:pentapeptide repeat-containing protein [Vibrio fluvialis]|uniref:pentapeptide repeat-containing protein n=1 Tax=Vibrio fluvialis TaxID=676 RepID=UPI00192BA8B6|nr:pentapeptide repeat-containing protein [Vibrio fluvialis]MBL4280750.1 pentapeptide repeat-containing protein [Vibrio fluvialis]
MVKLINKTPLRAVTFLFLVTLLIVVFITSCWELVSSHVLPNTTIGLYNKDFWENVLVEAHGMVFDILIIGVIVIWLDTRRTTYNEKKSMLNELSDMSYLDLPEVNHRKVGMMHRLNNLGVKTFDVEELIITKVRVKGLLLELSNFNFLKATGVTINETKFVETSLIRADFSDTVIKSSKFLKCDMKKAVFIQAKTLGIDYSNSNLERARFMNADLQNAIFKGCNLREANFENANLRNANLKGAKYVRAEHLLKAKSIDYIVVDEEVTKKLKELGAKAKGL